MPDDIRAPAVNWVDKNGCLVSAGIAAVAALIIGALLAPGWIERREREEREALEKAAADASAKAPQPAPSVAPIPPCDVNALWFGEGGAVDGSFEQRRAATVAILKNWTSDCRWRANVGNCEKRCDEITSEMLIDAAADNIEARRLLQWRHDRNLESVSAARALDKKISAFVAYAKRIVGSPRMNAYSTGTSLEAQANDLANGNPCLDRMRGDFVKLGALNAEIDAQLELLPEGSGGLKTLTAYAKSCVDCSDDRSMCKDMDDELKTYRENIADRQELVDSDATRLKKKP